MKPRTLPVKRTPVSKGMFKRLSAVTRNRKHRAATAIPSDFENEDHSSKISRALTIIFLIHIVVIGLIFFHQRFLDKDAPKQAAAKVESVLPAKEHHLPKLSSGDEIYRVSVGDNYGRIAEKHGVDEEELRAANDYVEIGPGSVMKIPAKRISATIPPEVQEIQERTPADYDRGLVEAVPVGTVSAPKAQLVKPAISHPQATTSPAPKVQEAVKGGQKHVVKSGDNIWRIASRYKVDQNALMKANGIKDPKKLRLGMTLTIPN